MSTKALKLRPVSPDTLEIRVFEAVCLNKRPRVEYPDFTPLRRPLIEAVIQRLMVPVQAVIYAPRPPSDMPNFLTIKAMAL